MKHLSLILLAVLLASCATPESNSLTPPAEYIITEYQPDGSIARVHTTQSFSEWGYPPTLTFKDEAGREVKISGSYLVELSQP